MNKVIVEDVGFNVNSIVLRTLDRMGKTVSTSTVKYLHCTKLDRINGTKRPALYKTFKVAGDELSLKLDMLRFCKSKLKNKESYYVDNRYVIEMRCAEGSWMLDVKL